MGRSLTDRVRGHRARVRRFGGACAALLLVMAGCSDDGDDSAEPTESTTTAPEATDESGAQADDERVFDTTGIEVTGPITGGRGVPQTATPIDLAARGYVEEEFFVSGDAVSYSPVGTFGEDGNWEVSEGPAAPYTTRILVRRPAAADRFNGTVVVEWLNVSSLVDLDAEFAFNAEEVLRGGYAWVGVSAQAAGVETSEAAGDLGPGAVGLKAWDPERYGTLSHPGDAHSYDIFSDVGAVLRQPGAVDPLGGLTPQVVLAVGESQSAFRLVTYVNAVQPRAGVYDGVLIHSRDGMASPLGEGWFGDEIPTPTKLRTDLDIPVLQVQSEADLYDLWPGDATRAFPPARQPDTDRIRTWEIAGAAHSDRHMLEYLAAQGSQFEGFPDLSVVFPTANDGPQTYVMRAALRALRDWVVDGTPPPRSQPIETADGAIVRDELGIARGGIRTPIVDVPVEVNSSVGLPLIGSRTPMDPAAIAARYESVEASRQQQLYRQQVEASLAAAISEGFVLADDRDELLADVLARFPSG